MDWTENDGEFVVQSQLVQAHKNKKNQFSYGIILCAFFLNPTGLCVKTRLLSGDGVGKVFINVCHTSGLPNPPKDVSDEELIKILASDEPTGFRVPMSIGEASEHPDKSGNPSIVYDVAVSSDFFAKVETSPIFKSFLVSVVLEGVQNKYDITLDTEEVVILKNRKVMGSLRPHRVQQREVNTQGPLIQEVYPPINTSSSSSKSKLKQGSSMVEKLDTVLPTSQTKERKPEYKIICEPAEGEPQHLVGEFKLTDVLSSQELTLDVGEDRIVLEGRKKGYLIDVFVPYLIDQDNTSALFDTSTRVRSIPGPRSGGFKSQSASLRGVGKQDYTKM
uniref:PIH1 domain-containing protein 1 n=1 Tax=Timema tahoe TaxID=61484 RepID=A0A7R9IMJ9_9NEOP|nr:unnamed protein product [Timema tahoe]